MDKIKNAKAVVKQIQNLKPEGLVEVLIHDLGLDLSEFFNELSTLLATEAKDQGMTGVTGMTITASSGLVAGYLIAKAEIAQGLKTEDRTLN